jgi:transcriptional regulator with XRE-family HTH domain
MDKELSFNIISSWPAWKQQVIRGNMKLGDRIKQRRHYVGISQVKLAKKTGLTPAAISQIENDKRVPSLNSFVKICDALRTTMDVLYNGCVLESVSMKDYKKAMKELEDNLLKTVRGGYLGT